MLDPREIDRRVFHALNSGDPGAGLQRTQRMVGLLVAALTRNGQLRESQLDAMLFELLHERARATAGREEQGAGRSRPAP